MITRTDTRMAILAGVATGVFAAVLLGLVGQRALAGLPLIIGTPLLFWAGLWLGEALGCYFPFFKRLSRFSIVGFLSATLDNGVLAILVHATNITAGPGYPVIRAIAIVIAVINSYFWNKYWSFGAANTQHRGAEFIKFILVTGLAGLGNIIVSWSVVTFVTPQFGLDAKDWASIGAITGSIVALLTNFLGYHLVVFKTGLRRDSVD